MSKFDNNNRGVLFKNNKDGVESRADYRGNADILIEGKVYPFWMDAWLNTSRDGLTKFLAIRFKPKSETEKKLSQQPDFDDKIPF